MKKNILILSSMLALFTMTSAISISCKFNNFNEDKKKYIQKLNIANPYLEYGSSIPNFKNQNLKEINLMTGAKVLRIYSKNQPKIDFRDNIVLRPTELSYKFEYGNSIQINDKLFNSDDKLNVDYQNIELNKQDPNKYYPSKDKGNGFNNPYLFVPSKNSMSINSKQFIESLRKAKNISISINQRKNYWINWQGIRNINNKVHWVNVKDFKLGLLRMLLLNKNFRRSWALKNNITLNKDKEQEFLKQNQLNNFDLFEYLKSYNVDVHKLLDFNDKNLSICSADNIEHDWVDLFNNLFIHSNYIDAMPYEIINEKYKDFLTNLDWFYEYDKTFKDRYYASYYFINEVNVDEIKLLKNFFYDKNKKSISKIDFQFNTLPISKNTFGMQMYHAFLQNIVTTLNFDDLDINQQQEILHKYNDFNISYTRNVSKNKLSNNITINWMPTANKKFFNDSFSMLAYGLKANQLNKNTNINKILKSKNIAFLLLIHQLINQYGMLANQGDIWTSQAPGDLDISSFDSGINYHVLKDSMVNIFKPLIPKNVHENSLDFIDNSYYLANKKILNDLQSSNLDYKLKSAYFQEISKQLNDIIKKFYEQHPDAADIEFDIPLNFLNLQFNNQRQNVLEHIKTIFKAVNKHLKPNFVVIDDLAKYDLYFNQDASIYCNNSFELLKSNTKEFIATAIAKNYKLFLIFNKISSLTKSNSFILENTKKILNELNKTKLIINNEIFNKNLEDYNKNFFIIKSIILKYLENISYQDQLNIINDINSLLSYTFSFENIIKTVGFSKVIYQKFINKPISYDGLSYLQDIVIE